AVAKTAEALAVEAQDREPEAFVGAHPLPEVGLEASQVLLRRAVAERIAEKALFADLEVARVALVVRLADEDIEGPRVDVYDLRLALGDSDVASVVHARRVRPSRALALELSRQLAPARP